MGSAGHHRGTEILILPVIGASARFRTFAWIGCAAVHLIISYFFNFAFVYGEPNGLDRMLGLTGKTGLGRRVLRPDRLGDPDAVRDPGLRCGIHPDSLGATGRLLGAGTILMAFGYALNCLGTLYDTDKASVP